MAKYMNLKINNSKEASIKSGKWKDPGAKLFDQLLNAAYFASDDVDDPRNENTWHYLREVYLVAPVKNIKYGPHGQTPYSRSGCKYPHHAIRNGELIVHEGGLKAAYIRAKQMGIFSGEVKEHLERHYKELGLYENSNMKIDESMENNFDLIESYIYESTGIDLYSPIELFGEASHGNLKSSFRKGLNIENGHIIKVVFDLDSIQINPDQITDPTKRQKLLHYVKKNGHNNFVGKGTVTAIIDEDSSQRLQSVKMIGIWSDNIFTIPKNIRREYDYNADRLSTYPLDVREKIVHDQKFNIKDSDGIMSISVGKEIDRPAFMATSNVKSLKAFADLIDYGTKMRQRGTPVKEYLKKKDLEYTDSILESEIFEEKSHGNLKYSFRNGINPDNGHIMKIVFNLNPDDISHTGHTFASGASNENHDRDSFKNIRKTGNNNFASKGKVVAIIDTDTNQRLHSCKLIGALSSYINDIEPIVGADHIIWDNIGNHKIFSAFNLNDKFVRSLLVKSKSWNPPSNIIQTFTVGQIEDGVTYKATKFSTSMNRMIDNMNTDARVKNYNGRGVDRTNDDTMRKINAIGRDIKNINNALRRSSITKDEFIKFSDLAKKYIDIRTKAKAEERPQYVISYLSDCKAIQHDIHSYISSLSLNYNKLNESVDIYEEASRQMADIEEFMIDQSENSESANNNIYPLKRADVTSPYFVKWLFKTDEFCDNDPEKFDFDILVNNPAAGNFVYGYYVNNLEGIIRVKYRKDEDYYSINMLFVNAESEGSGIGQSLLKYAIDKFGHKEMRLNVFTFNKRAIHIYKKYGFEVSDTIEVEEEPGESSKFVGKKMYIMKRDPDEYLQEGKFTDVVKYLGNKITQFLQWSSDITKTLKNVQMLSMPNIMSGPTILFPIIGTSLHFTVPKDFKEYNEYHDYIFTEDIKDEKLFDSNIRMKYIGMFASEVKKAVLEFGSKYNVSVAVDTKGITNEIAFVSNKERFVKNYKQDLDNGTIQILYEDPKYNDIMCISLKPFSWYADPMNAKRLQWIIAHEYGHILTLPSLSDEMFWSTINKVKLLRVCKHLHLGTSGHYYRNYYEIPVEKIANDAVGIVTDDDISCLSGCSKYRFSGWKDSIFHEIVKLDIPGDIISISKKSVDNYSENDIVYAIQYSIETYSKLLPSKEVSKIVNYLKTIKPSEIIEYIKNGEGIQMESVGSDDLSWIESYLMEDGENAPHEKEGTPPKPPEPAKPAQAEKKESMPQKAAKAEASANGVRRKKLYIAFIEWAKGVNPKNTFGSIFDKDAFNTLYPFVDHDMRYFYRLANPMLCVLQGDLTFFAVAELRKLNMKNSRLSEMMIFAATKDDVRVFNKKDKKVYRGTEENGMLKLAEVLGETFDTYIQKMINQGDILNGPITESAEDLLSLSDEGWV